MINSSFELKEEKILRRVEIKTLVCDNCGRETTDGGDILIGGSYFGGWYHLNRELRGAWLAELQKPRSFDFCSLKCLQEWAAGRDIYESDIVKFTPGAKVCCDDYEDTE